MPASIAPFSGATVIVRVWFVLTALVALGGVIETLPSTQVLLASRLPPALVLTAVLVARVTDWPLTENVVVTWTVLVPVFAEVIVTVQVGAAAV